MLKDLTVEEIGNDQMLSLGFGARGVGFVACFGSDPRAVAKARKRVAGPACVLIGLVA